MIQGVVAGPRDIMEDIVGMRLGADQAREFLAHGQLAGQAQLEAANALEIADQAQAEDQHQQSGKGAVNAPFQPVLLAGEYHAPHAVDQWYQGDDGTQGTIEKQAGEGAVEPIAQ
ncbi:hypothetical protein A8U91_04199 [Halomonas elongata]|uniref:Uncharacterized protein n=1 Tax=Halomonas elongata TaxID=2746 RepID=A0A1B8NYQ4_HALEL|nr:hypothetical protein A8U91_04199 [Halomonas elongata]